MLWGTPCWSNGWNSALSLWRSWVPSMAGELKFPRVQPKKKKEKERKKQCYECMCVAFRLLFFPITEQGRELKRSGVKEVKPVHPKGNQPWIFIARTDAEAEAPKLWPPDAKSQLTGKDPDAGKDGGQEEKGATEDETVGWHHQLNGQEFEQTPPGDGEGQGGLACCSPRGCKELATHFVTEQMG